MARRPIHADEILPLLKRHEIQVLLRAGHSQTDVAARTGASVDTVRRVKRETEVTTADDAVEGLEGKIGRPSKATPFAARARALRGAEREREKQEHDRT